VTFLWDSLQVIQAQEYYVVHVADQTVSRDHLDEVEAISTLGYRWWTIQQFHDADDSILPDVRRAVEAATAQ
jgi:hypothetical protein